MPTEPMRMRLSSLLNRILVESHGRGRLFGHFNDLRRIMALTPDADLRCALADYVDCVLIEVAELHDNDQSGWWNRRRTRRTIAADQHIVTLLRLEVLGVDLDIEEMFR